VAKLAPNNTKGDGDPLDICVISERPINRSEVLLRAIVVGGLKLIDRGEADDKIIAVLEGDYIWGGARELGDLPAALVERLEHYFETYKLVPGQPAAISIAGKYGYEDAAKVIRASLEDYGERYGRLTLG
jgi:inorganic pyrophosphatase